MPDPSWSPVPGLQPDTSFLRSIIRQLRLAWRLFLDPRVPLVLKLIPPAAFLYVIWPLDFAPDLLPGLGQLDDLAVLGLSIKLFIELAPPTIVQEHLREMEAVTTSWRVVDDRPHESGQIIDAPYQIEKPDRQTSSIKRHDV